MALCERILGNCIQVSCENPIFEGVEAEALILNKNQINSFSYDQSNGSICNGITMKTYTSGSDTVSYCGYTCNQLGNKPYDGSQIELVEGQFGNKFNSTVVLAVPDNGPEISANIIDNLANGTFTVILNNSYRHANGDNKYQIYGTSRGLKATSIVREVWGDNSSMWIVTLVEENAGKSSVFFYSTDEATTDTAYNALKCTCE